MNDILESRIAQIANLCEKFGVIRLGVFGSFVKGNTDETSDVDFIVDFGPPDPIGASARYFGLLEGLRDLLGLEVDLVCSDAIRNPVFRREVESSKIELYAA